MQHPRHTLRLSVRKFIAISNNDRIELASASESYTPRIIHRSIVNDYHEVDIASIMPDKRLDNIFFIFYHG